MLRTGKLRRGINHHRSMRLESLEPKTLLAAINDWEIRGPGGGGALYNPSINPHDPAEIYIASDMGQIFHTTDGGASWETVDFRSLEGGRDAPVRFTNDSNIRYTIDRGEINGDSAGTPMKSTDGGQTWQPLPGDPTGGGSFNLFVNYDNPNVVILAAWRNLYVSLDGGNNFQLEYQSPNAGAGLHASGAHFNGNDIYIGSRDELLVSNDGGNTFQAAGIGGIPAGEAIANFAGATENGTTRLWVVTGNSGDIYGGVQGWEHSGYEAVYTFDVGQTAWQQTTSGIATGATPFYVAAARNDIDTVYVSGGSSISHPTVFKSENGGSNWSDVLRTNNNENIETGWSGDGGVREWWYGENALGFGVNPLDADDVIITDYGFAHGTTDGGDSWQVYNVHPDDRNAAGEQIDTATAYRSSGLTNLSIWGLTWADADSIIGSYSDIRGARSDDGGTSWSFNYSGHTQNTMYRAVTHTSNGNVYAATATVHDMYQSTHLTDSRIDGGSGRVLFSGDEGHTWQTLHDFGDVVMWVELDPTNPNRLYAAVSHSTRGGIYVSDDIQNGAASTWTKLADPPRTEGHAFNIRVLDNGDLVTSFSARRDGSGFTASSGVFYSTDGGQSWQDRSDSDMHYWTKDVILDPHDSSQSTWYATVFSGWGGPANDKGGIYRTTDRGQTWDLVFDSYRVNSLTISPTNPDEAYATTETEGLWYTENLNAPNPTFTQVDGYPFRQPMRVHYNPFDTDEVWVTSFGNGLFVGRTNDGTPSPGVLRLDASSYQIGEDGASLSVTVERIGGSDGAVSVNYATVDSTATAGADYTATSGTLSFADGETEKTFAIPILDDALLEGDEFFDLMLSDVAGATLGSPASATVTIADNETAQPGTLAVAQTAYTVAEDGGTVTVEVIRSGGSDGEVTVDYQLIGISATAGSDFAADSGVLTFTAGETSQTIVVSILDDTQFESTETLAVMLSNPTGGAALGDSQATISITDDDIAPPASTLEFSSPTYGTQEDWGYRPINVRRDGDLSQPATVDYQVVGGTAAQGIDYSLPAGTLSFAAGEDTATIILDLHDDSLVEPTETVVIALSDPSNAELGDTIQATVEIRDDEVNAAGSLRFSSATLTVKENWGAAVLYVRREEGLVGEVTVDYSVSPGTAIPGVDYQPVTGTLTFAEGQHYASVWVPLVNDLILEPDESFTVTLSNPGGGATIGSTAETTVTIEDDEVNAAGTVEFHRAEYRVKENWGAAVIYLKRTDGLIGDISIDYATGIGSATAGSDYQPVSGTAHFASGQRYATVWVPITNDLELEPDETIPISLSNPTGGALLGDRSAVEIVIEDNEVDAPGVLQFSSSLYKTRENWGYVEIYVKRSGGLIGEVSVDYEVTAGTARAGEDYAAENGTLTLADGQQSTIFRVYLKNDKVVEGTETLDLRLLNAGGGAVIGERGSAVVMIADDD